MPLRVGRVTFPYLDNIVFDKYGISRLVEELKGYEVFSKIRHKPNRKDKDKGAYL
jgi:hypothetical protein